MQFGIGSYAYAWAIGVPGHMPPTPMNHVVFLRRAAQLSAPVVQFADNLPLHTLPEADLEKLIEEAQQSSITVEVGTRGIDPDHLRTYLRIAAMFNSPVLRVVVDTAEHEPSPDEIVETLSGMLSDFVRYNVVLAIENHDRFKVATLRDILQRIDSPYVGICLDTVNSFGSLEGPEVVVDTLAPFVVNLHVKDFTIQRVDSNMGFTIYGTPAGKGRLDMPWLLDKLSGRVFNAIIELWPEPEPTIADTLKKEDKWVVESVNYMRELLSARGDETASQM